MRKRIVSVWLIPLLVMEAIIHRITNFFILIEYNDGTEASPSDRFGYALVSAAVLVTLFATLIGIGAVIF